MYAIVEMAGQQFKVAKDQKLFVHRLDANEGDVVTFDNVLLIDNDGTVTIGAPAVEGAAVKTKVLKHLKGDKVIVFKKKRRKGYQVKNGHRQLFTQVVVEEILASGAQKQEKVAKKAPAKKATAGDDLKIVEGIGPKAAEALTNAGVETFEKLSKKTAEEIKKILVEASSTLSHLDPTTWAKQAEMAVEGKWEELKKWQDELNGGVQR